LKSNLNIENIKMAAIFPLRDLNDDQAKLISLCLTFQPTDKNAEERKKWANAPQFYSKAALPVTMYRIQTPNSSLLEDGSASLSRPSWPETTPETPISTADSIVRIPFRFACSLFKKMVNHDKIYPRVFETPLDRPNFCAALRDYQVQPALEAYQQLQTWASTTLKLPPGFGKTMIGAWLWSMTSTVCLVLVVQQPLLRQWKNTFSTAVPGLAQSIWVVGDDSPPSPGVIPAIILCMNQRTHHIPQYIKDAVGCLIIDEAHCFCTPDRVESLLSFTPKYVIAETATLERDDGMEKIIHSICGEHNVSRVATKPYGVIRLDTSLTVDETRNKYGINFSDLCNKLCALPERNQIIVDIIKSNPHRKFMVLTRLADHVALLQLLITQSGISCATLYRNQKTYSDSPVLVGTIPKIGTGFDEANSCDDFGGVQSDTLILASSIKKTTVFEQIRGRVMRSSNPVVIYLVDRNSVCKRHFKDTSSWIEYTQGVITRLTYYPGNIHLPSTSRDNLSSRDDSSSRDNSQPMCLKTQGAPPLETYLREAKMFQPFSEVGRSTFASQLSLVPSCTTLFQGGSPTLQVSNSNTTSPIRLQIRKEHSVPSSPETSSLCEDLSRGAGAPDFTQSNAAHHLSNLTSVPTPRSSSGKGSPPASRDDQPSLRERSSASETRGAGAPVLKHNPFRGVGAMGGDPCAFQHKSSRSGDGSTSHPTTPIKLRITKKEGSPQYSNLPLESSPSLSDATRLIESEGVGTGVRSTSEKARASKHTNVSLGSIFNAMSI
jgi:superfamily II DNA or RNA helicase